MTTRIRAWELRRAAIEGACRAFAGRDLDFTVAEVAVAAGVSEADVRAVAFPWAARSHYELTRDRFRRPAHLRAR